MNEDKSPVEIYGDNLGAHTSIAGGKYNAFDGLRKIGGCTLQIFCKNQRQWQGAELDEEEVEQFHETREEFGMEYPIVVHSGYLINLCSKNESTRQKSKKSMLDELERTARLGVEYFNFHPGNHTGKGEEWGIDKIVDNLNEIIEQEEEYGFEDVLLVLENTAGKGTALGKSIDELAAIIEGVERDERLGVCWDTCHGFSAGYDIRDEDSYHEVWEEFDDKIGLDRLVAFHLNDSKHGLGTNKDRHANIGEGEIGRRGFELLVNDDRFKDLPMVLETPTEDDGYRRDLETLRELRG